MAVGMRLGWVGGKTRRAGVSLASRTCRAGFEPCRARGIAYEGISFLIRVNTPRPFPGGGDAPRTERLKTGAKCRIKQPSPSRAEFFSLPPRSNLTGLKPLPVPNEAVALFVYQHQFIFGETFNAFFDLVG